MSKYKCEYYIITLCKKINFEILYKKISFSYILAALLSSHAVSKVRGRSIRPRTKIIDAKTYL